MRRKTIIILTLLLFNVSVFAQAKYDEIELQVWANEAIVATYTYNYQNFLQRQKEIAKYFTANGWISYSKALQDSKLPETIKENNYFVSAVALEPPTIKQIKPTVFQASLPVLVVYKNPKITQKQKLKVDINFTLVPQGQGVRGKAINSLKAIELEAPCKCE